MENVPEGIINYSKKQVRAAVSFVKSTQFQFLEKKGDRTLWTDRFSKLSAS
jgi:hypothetical protein